MQVVIKGTKTIDEFKNLKVRMETLATEMCEKHKNACENRKK